MDGLRGVIEMKCLHIQIKEDGKEIWGFNCCIDSISPDRIMQLIQLESALKAYKQDNKEID